MSSNIITLDPDVQSIELISRKAALSEFNGDYDEAFKFYVNAAQSYLRIVRGNSIDSSRTINEGVLKNLKKEAQKCLERAERIKSAKKDLAPLPKDPFSEGEDVVRIVYVVY